MPGSRVELELAGERYYAVMARTFADARPGDVILYEDSYRNMSVAINRGNAASMLHARTGPAARDPRAWPGVPECARVGGTEERSWRGQPARTLFPRADTVIEPIDMSRSGSPRAAHAGRARD